MFLLNNFPFASPYRLPFVLTENNGKQSLRMTVHVKIIRSQAVLPTQLLILFKASPRNSDCAIAQSDFSSDETKIRRL